MHFGSARKMENIIQVPFVGLRRARSTVYIPSAFHWTYSCICVMHGKWKILKLRNI